MRPAKGSAIVFQTNTAVGPLSLTWNDVAAPAFREIAQQALNYLNVPPSKTGPDLTVSRRSEVAG